MVLDVIRVEEPAHVEEKVGAVHWFVKFVDGVFDAERQKHDPGLTGEF